MPLRAAPRPCRAAASCTVRWRCCHSPGKSRCRLACSRGALRAPSPRLSWLMERRQHAGSGELQGAARGVAVGSGEHAWRARAARSSAGHCRSRSASSVARPASFHWWAPGLGSRIGAAWPQQHCSAFVCCPVHSLKGRLLLAWAYMSAVAPRCTRGVRLQEAPPAEASRLVGWEGTSHTQ